MRSAASASAPGFLEVIAPGPQSLLQDSGRRGQWHLGITSAGPMDRLSFDWALYRRNLFGVTCNFYH